MSYLDQMNPMSVLNAIGMGRNEPVYYFSDNVLPALAIFSAGLLVGAGVALLVTPKTGRELRGDITRKASEITETVKNKLPEQLAGGNENGRRTHSQQVRTTTDI